MIVRKLPQQENGTTRAFYEEVFAEDKGPFSEYYYQTKARSNEIYVIEQEGEICSMLHLNPVRSLVFGQKRDLSYIVAVATKESCRHQGMMRRLLTRALQDTAQRGEPFVFLMPANEAYYTPFGFRRSWKWQSEGAAIPHGLFHEADYSDLETDDEQTYDMLDEQQIDDEKLELLSRRVNFALAKKFDIYTDRSVGYYRNLGVEQRASGGRLMIAMSGRQPVYATAEPAESFPDMMARVSNVQSFFELVHADEERREYWQITDPIIPDNNGIFQIDFSRSGSRAVRLDTVPAGCSVRQVPVEDLMSMLGRVFLCEVV